MISINIYLLLLIPNVSFFSLLEAFNTGRFEHLRKDQFQPGDYIPVVYLSFCILVILLLHCANSKKFTLPKKTLSNRPCGLKNTQETCYMNSMIQALASSNILIKKYKSSNLESASAKLFFNLLNGINGNDDVDQNTERLLELIKASNWKKTSQQDVFQLLSYIIKAVQKKKNNGKKTMPPKLKVLHSFTANSEHNKVQDHLGLSIPLCGNFRKKPGVDIKVLMDAFFEPSIIDDGPNSTSLNLFEKAPKVLILHIQANEWDDKLGMNIKPEYHIKYEKTLTYTFDIKMDTNMSRSENIEVEYELMAVVRHMGGISGGHYVTYRRHGHQWFLTNDEQVEAINFECQVVPYVMVYDKVKEKAV